MTDIHEIDDPAEAAALFDGICRRSLRISGLEFLARYDRGDYNTIDCYEDALEAIMALPFIRDIPGSGP